MTNIKHSGQIFTPDYLVNIILDTAGYNSPQILKKHCIDNSCGDGAFLCEIVSRYCTYFLKKRNKIDNLKKELELYIHGIELDTKAYHICIENLNITVEKYGLKNIIWDVLNQDTLNVTRFNQKMDFVIGNPPYVRVHNLVNSYNGVKTYAFANGGMTDLFLVFFEIGFNMLKRQGKLCYITPSSWINSIAGSNMRKYILSEKNLIELIDLKHYQAFKTTTYTMISLFQKGIVHNKFKLYNFNGEKRQKDFVDELALTDIYINNNFYLASQKELKSFNQIINSSYPPLIKVKNGFATLADHVFINESFPFKEFTIPVIKASTGKWYKAFFPYDANGKPIDKSILFHNPTIVNYLEEHLSSLLKGKTKEEKKDWYLFGRTQALKDVQTEKYAINTCIKDINSIKLNIVPKGSGIYSGLYILTDIKFEKLKSVIYCQDFINYIALLGKYKSGGYYTLNSKDLEHYLNFKIHNN